MAMIGSRAPSSCLVRYGDGRVSVVDLREEQKLLQELLEITTAMPKLKQTNMIELFRINTRSLFKKTEIIVYVDWKTKDYIYEIHTERVINFGFFQIVIK